MAIVSAAPALKPSRMVSLMKFTSVLSRKIHSTVLSTATSRAVSAAISVARSGSPDAMPAIVVPTSIEIAEVGPTAS
jgi:hypothetical protein